MKVMQTSYAIYTTDQVITVVESNLSELRDSLDLYPIETKNNIEP